MTKVIQTGKDIIRVSTDWLGRELSMEVNRVGFRTTSTVMVRYGDTVVLGMVNSGDVNPNLDYFPLSIDYEEKFYAAGKISNNRRKILSINENYSKISLFPYCRKGFPTMDASQNPFPTSTGEEFSGPVRRLSSLLSEEYLYR